MYKKHAKNILFVYISTYLHCDKLHSSYFLYHAFFLCERDAHSGLGRRAQTAIEHTPATGTKTQTVGALCSNGAFCTDADMTVSSGNMLYNLTLVSQSPLDGYLQLNCNSYTVSLASGVN